MWWSGAGGAGGEDCGLAWLNGVNRGRCSLAGVGDATRYTIGDIGGGGGGGGGCGGVWGWS